MLILHVSQPMQPGAPALQGHFNERGGTIGRAPECTLRLPDPEKHISRVQAEVRYSGGQFALLNRSSVNPLTLNGQPLNPDEARPLRAGDEIVVAQFVLHVELTAGAWSRNQLASADDPFADLIPKTQPVWPPAQRSGLKETPGRSQASGTGAVQETGHAYIPEDAFADLEQFAPTPQPKIAPPANSLSRPLSRPPAANPFGVDPFAADPFAAPSRSMHDTELPLGQVREDDPLQLGSFEQPQESIDDLFGLGSTHTDPLAMGSPLANPSLRAAGRSTTPGAMSDHVPEIHAAVKLPKLQAATVRTPTPLPTPSPVPPAANPGQAAGQT